MSKITIELDAYELQLLNLAIGVTAGFFPKEQLSQWLQLANKINKNNAGWLAYNITLTDLDESIFKRD